MDIGQATVEMGFKNLLVGALFVKFYPANWKSSKYLFSLQIWMNPNMVAFSRRAENLRAGG